MRFSELVQILEQHEFKLIKEKEYDDGGNEMIALNYSLVIEATAEPDFFGFYSPDLEGFTGVGHSIEDCLYQARWGMQEHVNLLREQGLPVAPQNPNPRIVIQNETKLVPA